MKKKQEIKQKEIDDSYKSDAPEKKREIVWVRIDNPISLGMQIGLGMLVLFLVVWFILWFAGVSLIG